MAVLFPLLVLLLPIGEILVFILAGDLIGFWATLGLIVLTSVIGVTLIRVEGLTSIRRFQDSLEQQEFPEKELFNTVGILLAGLFLLIPGFITDVLGVLIFVPSIREFIRTRLFRHLTQSGFVFVKSSAGEDVWREDKGTQTIIEGDFTVVETEEGDSRKIPPSSHDPKS